MQGNALPLRDRFHYASDQCKGVRYQAANYDRQLIPLRHCTHPTRRPDRPARHLSRYCKRTLRQTSRPLMRVSLSERAVQCTQSRRGKLSLPTSLTGSKVQLSTKYWLRCHYRKSRALTTYPNWQFRAPLSAKQLLKSMSDQRLDFIARQMHAASKIRGHKVH
jgi:hypothetical protein